MRILRGFPELTLDLGLKNQTKLKQTNKQAKRKQACVKKGRKKNVLEELIRDIN